MGSSYKAPGKRSNTGLYVLGFVLVILGAVGGAVWYFFPSVPQVTGSSMDLRNGATVTISSQNKLSFTIDDITSDFMVFGEKIGTISAQDVVLAADSDTTFNMPVKSFSPTKAVARHCMTKETFPATITTKVKASLWGLVSYNVTLPQQQHTFACPTPSEFVELLGPEAANP